MLGETEDEQGSLIYTLVFGVPNGREEVARDINKSLPKYIIKPDSAIGYFLELENIINTRYTHVAKIETADIYVLKM